MNQPPTHATRLRLVPSGSDPSGNNLHDGTGGEAPALKPRLLAIVPSWLFSLVLHAALFIVLAASLPGFRGGIVGDPDGDLRSVGIWVGHSGGGDGGDEGGSGNRPANAALGETKLIPTAPSSPTATPAVSAPVPPLPTMLPDTSAPLVPAREQSVAPTNAATPAPILGPGERPERPGLFQSHAEPRPPVGKTANGALGDGRGTGRRGSRGSTPFFGIVDVGSQFVYVIDCSGSMYSHKAIDAAKSELAKSLRSLNRFQRFQIVFYNTDQKWLKVPGKVDFGFFPADDKNLRRAGEFIAEIQPEGGTVHMGAIELALRLHPDVIFFLTDGGKPGLSSSDLEELARLNQRHTRIHCVQFSAQDDPDAAQATDFLHKLAAQNDGEYVSRDVSRFDTPQAVPGNARPVGEEP
jgi:hypothetical protein